MIKILRILVDGKNVTALHPEIKTLDCREELELLRKQLKSRYHTNYVLIDTEECEI